MFKIQGIIPLFRQMHSTWNLQLNTMKHAIFGEATLTSR